MSTLRVGIDFDNTIVCYDQVFHEAAVGRGLVQPELTATKEAVRDYLRGVNREDDWTELQGFVYGTQMLRAEPFPGVQTVISSCRQAGIPVFIISHKTRHPYKGPQYDLHDAAWTWLEEKAFFHEPVGLTRECVFFEETKAAKLTRIEQCGCTHFIDDLPEFLAEPAFPMRTHRILFDPARKHTQRREFDCADSWDTVGSMVRPDRGIARA